LAPAQLQALEVFGLADLALGVRHLAEAILAPGQRHHAGLLQRGEDRLADLALRERVQRLVIGHQERQREQVQFPDLRRPVDGRAHRHVDHALADRREFASLVAGHQRGARVQLDVDAAVGALFDQVGPDLAALAPREGWAEHQRHLVLGLVGLGHRAGGGEGGSGNDGGRCEHQGTTFHFISSRERRQFLLVNAE
jgi:hypothetical protein